MAPAKLQLHTWVDAPFPFPWTKDKQNHCPFCGNPLRHCGLDGHWADRYWKRFYITSVCKVFGLPKPKIQNVRVGDTIDVAYPIPICPVCNTTETLGDRFICGFTGALVGSIKDGVTIKVRALCSNVPLCTCNGLDLTWQGCTCGAFQKEKALRENSP